MIWVGLEIYLSSGSWLVVPPQLLAWDIRAHVYDLDTSTTRSDLLLMRTVQLLHTAAVATPAVDHAHQPHRHLNTAASWRRMSSSQD